MKKRETLADVIKRLTHEFVDSVVREMEAAVAETRSSRATRVRRAPAPAARDARTPRARTTASPSPERARAPKSQKSQKRVRKVIDVDATVVDPEKLLAAIEHAQHTPEPAQPQSQPQPEAHEEPAPPPASQEQPKPASRPSTPPLRENETAITTSSGAIVIRRSRAA